jgi:hypothetical protein
MENGVAGLPRVTITHTLPPLVRAGELFRWSLTIRAAADIAAGSTIGLARRWPHDGGLPQWHDPVGRNFVAATGPTNAAVAIEALRREDWHPFDHALLLRLAHGLAPGNELTVTYGAPPSPGFEAQTFIEAAAALQVFMQPAGGAWQPVARIMTKVVGGAPHRLVAIAPSIVAAGETLELIVRLEDIWGNPATGEDLDLVTSCGLAGRIKAEHGAVARLRLGPLPEGVHRIEVADRAQRLRAVSNPIRCVQAPQHRLYWGDLHAQSANGCGAQTIADYFAFARDFAGADFAGHQGNCFLLSSSDWEESEDVTRRCNEDGRFVTLLGYEWSGETAVGGDHNVYFPGDTGELRRCSHRHVPDTSDLATDLTHVTDLHTHVRGRNLLLALHVGGRTSNLEWHEPSTERLLEVHSTHATSEWFLFEALRRGYRLGVVGGSDGVDGRPGASHPGRMAVRNLRGGLAAVKMPALSRAHLWAALCERATYATTGERILLEVDVDGRSFGAVGATRTAPRIAVGVEATAPLTSVEIFRGCEPIFAAPIAAVDAAPSSRLRLSWCGASAPGNWSRARLHWEGRIEVAGGRLLSARDWAADTPAEGITAWSAAALTFRSITAGNWNGVEIELEERPETVIGFRDGDLAVEFPLRLLARAPVQSQWDEPHRLVRLQRLPRLPAALGWTGGFVDAAAPPGEHAYWVRVHQDDGGCAWSSPVYVRVG